MPIMTIRDSYPTAEKPERFDPSRTQVDEIKMFPPVVTESEDLVGYLRTGGCTTGCGACCEAFVVPISREGVEHPDFEGAVHGQIVLPIEAPMQGKAGFKDWEYWLTLHEVWVFQSPGGLLTVPVPIKAKSKAPTADFADWVAWLEEHGITVLRRFGQQLMAHIPIPCTKLEDGVCTLFDTPERPRMCARYPQHPSDVEGIDFCTYKFQPIKRGQMVPLMKRTKPQQPKAKPKRKKRQSKKGNRQR